MPAAITFLSAAESAAFDAVQQSAERCNTSMLPYSHDVHAALCTDAMGVTGNREYVDFAGWTRVEVTGEIASGHWRVVLSTAPAPQAARYR